MRVSRVALLVAIIATGSSALAESVVLTGKVTRATVYRGQAMVTRDLKLEGEAGAYEVVVADLPQHVVGDSLFAESGENAEVRAVRYRERAVGEEPREAVRQLDQQILEVTDQLAMVEAKRKLLNNQTEYLDKLEGFVAPTAKAELSKGVLDAEVLQQVTTFTFAQRQEIAEAELAAMQQKRELDKHLLLLQRKRAELTTGASESVREAVLFVQKLAGDPERIRLNYLVNNCGWSPSYTFRADGDEEHVQIEYSGLISQMSGEDWNNVALTLSTASPSLSAARPGLAPFYVTLNAQSGGKQQAMNEPPAQVAQQVEMLRQQQRGANFDNRNTFSLQGNIASSFTINDMACKIQWFELTSPKDALQVGDLKDAGAADEPSHTYELKGPVSLASRSDQQMIRILKADFASTFYHVATPVLTSYVHREAELINSSQHDLLAGPISVYLSGRFVGRGEIPSVARGQAFVVGFGADPQLRARRELVQKTDDVQGGNKELSIEYRLALENYKSVPVTVRLMDRLPHPERSADVRVTLLETDTELSDDPLYLRNDRPKGILRWDVEVPAEAAGETAKILQYGFRVEFDRNYQLTTEGKSQERLQEFEQQERARLKY